MTIANRHYFVMLAREYQRRALHKDALARASQGTALESHDVRARPLHAPRSLRRQITQGIEMDTKQLGYARYCEASDVVKTALHAKEQGERVKRVYYEILRKYAARVIGYHAA